MATTTDMAPTAAKKSATASRTASKARERELEEQVAQLQEDLKAITSTLRKLSGEKANTAQNIAISEMQHLKSQGEAMLAEAQDQASVYEKQLKDTIREKPLTAVASALGVGFVLALLTRH